MLSVWHIFWYRLDVISTEHPMPPLAKLFLDGVTYLCVQYHVQQTARHCMQHQTPKELLDCCGARTRSDQRWRVRKKINQCYDEHVLSTAHAFQKISGHVGVFRRLCSRLKSVACA